LQHFVCIYFIEMNIGERIKQIADKKGVKMEHIYNSIGMTNAGFYRMLKNNSFKVDTLLKIAETLKVNPVEFLIQEGGMFIPPPGTGPAQPPKRKNEIKISASIEDNTVYEALNVDLLNSASFNWYMLQVSLLELYQFCQAYFESEEKISSDKFLSELRKIINMINKEGKKHL
jgi:DNA-binding Xre family transcriptional regulator